MIGEHITYSGHFPHVTTSRSQPGEVIRISLYHQSMILGVPAPSGLVDWFYPPVALIVRHEKGPAFHAVRHFDFSDDLPPRSRSIRARPFPWERAVVAHYGETCARVETEGNYIDDYIQR